MNNNSKKIDFGNAVDFVMRIAKTFHNRLLLK